MPKHMLMSDIEIITDGGRRGRRRWSALEKLRLVGVEEDRGPPQWRCA